MCLLVQSANETRIESRVYSKSLYHKVANTFRLTKIARELTWTVELVLFDGAYLSRVYRTFVLKSTNTDSTPWAPLYLGVSSHKSWLTRGALNYAP